MTHNAAKISVTCQLQPITEGRCSNILVKEITRPGQARGKARASVARPGGAGPGGAGPARSIGGRAAGAYSSITAPPSH